MPRCSSRWLAASRKAWAVLLLIPSVVSAAERPQVALYESEIWLMHGGRLQPLTSDKKQKGGPLLSPKGTRVAYYEQCTVAEHCTPNVVILDLNGNGLMGMQPHSEKPGASGTCMSILGLHWISENVISMECHENPSLNDYIETDLSTGRNRRELTGFAFAPSPDGKWVAHAGWTMHFGPPYTQSEYVQVDDETVYPVREHETTNSNGLPSVPDVVKLVGGTYVGIHQILPPLVWSPDSLSIAFVDCTYNWTPNTPSSLSAADGKESGSSCSLAVAGPQRRPQHFPIRGDVEKVVPEIEWQSRHRIHLQCGSTVEVIDVP